MAHGVSQTRNKTALNLRGFRSAIPVCVDGSSYLTSIIAFCFDEGGASNLLPFRLGRSQTAELRCAWRFRKIRNFLFKTEKRKRQGFSALSADSRLPYPWSSPKHCRDPKTASFPDTSLRTEITSRGFDDNSTGALGRYDCPPVERRISSKTKQQIFSVEMKIVWVREWRLFRNNYGVP